MIDRRIIRQRSVWRIKVSHVTLLLFIRHVTWPCAWRRFLCKHQHRENFYRLRVNYNTDKTIHLVITSVQSDLAKGRIAAARTHMHRECTRSQWALSRQTMRSALTRRYVTTGRHMFPSKVPVPACDLDLCPTQSSLSPYESGVQQGRI